jgi:hypothetical protein
VTTRVCAAAIELTFGPAARLADSLPSPYAASRGHTVYASMRATTGRKRRM